MLCPQTAFTAERLIGMQAMKISKKGNKKPGINHNSRLFV
jgi:hypothetical protein